MLVRKAVPADIPAVTAIYGALLDREERGELSTGWTRGVYPTEQTALDALAAGTLYVLEDGGRVAAAAKLDQNQMAQYSQCTWRHDAPPEQVLVLHTLVVDPTVKGKGYGTAFVAFYEQLARETDRPYLRIDTNARNTPARALYKKLGYTEAGIVAGTFNGIPDVQLVCLEKRYKTKDEEVPEMALIHVNESDFREQVLETAARCWWISGPTGAAPAVCWAPCWSSWPLTGRTSPWPRWMWTRICPWPRPTAWRASPCCWCSKTANW